MRSLLGIVVLICVPAVCGCADWNFNRLRGTGYGDETAHWGDKLRPPTQPGNIAGFDNRAREIEQNLGVR